MTSLSPTATNPIRERGTDSARDSLLARVVDEYLAACQAGERPDVEALLSRHPEIADDLAACLASLDFLENIAEQERMFVSPAPGENVNRNGNAAALRRVDGTLGDYRILGEIARGGMGVVYEAHQISLNRRVALKVLPFAAILDDRAKRRFQNEALAAAQLDHPHIVDVYGVGCERGVHYYAMRLIEGRSLAEIVQHLHLQLEVNPKYIPSSLADLVSTSRKNASTAAGPSNETLNLNPSTSSPAPSSQSLSPKPRPKLGRDYYRSIATLGMHIAEALDHAHEQGVLHRDIKPSNLMLDGSGKAWITDFGLAHIESAASLTHTGDLLGTLRYMSPEQALAKRVPIDHRSDIYSLGVTLYELLTLQPAFDSENRGELMRQVAFEEPTRPRQIDPQIPLDLETIILKAIAKNPADRYASSRTLVDDLQHFLVSEPIRARPIGVKDRLLRLARRHSLAITCALALTLVMAVALGIAFGLTFKARNDALAKGQELQRRHEQAVVILGRVNGTVDSMLERLSSLPAGDATRLAIIEDELAFYSGLQDIDEENPAASDQLALALHRMGHLQIELKRYDQAEDSLQKAIAILERRSREELSSAVHANTLCHAWMNLGRVQMEKKNVAAAVASFQRSIHHGERATRLSPVDCEFRMALAFPCGQLGLAYLNLGRAADAQAAHRQEIELHRRNVASRPEHWPYQSVLGSAIYLYSYALSQCDEYERATQTIEEAIAIYEKLHRARPEDWLIRSRLAKFHIRRASWIQGTYRVDLENAMAQMSPDASVLSSAAWHISRHPKSNPATLRQAAQWAASAVKSQPESAAYWNTQGLVQFRIGNFSEALTALEKSRQLSPSSGGCNAALQAMCFEHLDQHDRAVALYREATTWARQNAPKDDELSALCREAATLLGLTEPPSP